MDERRQAGGAIGYVTGLWGIGGVGGTALRCHVIKDCQDETAARPATEKNVETHIYRSICVSGFSIKRMIAIRNGYGGICHEDMTM